MERGITPHETYDLHELLTMKNICATKCFTMSKLVRDEELKSIMQEDLAAARQHAKELQALIETSFLGSFKTFQPVQTSRFASDDVLDRVKEKEVPPCTESGKGASL